MNEGRLTSLLKRLSERVCDWVIAGVRKMRRAGAACAVSANGTLQKSADWKRSAKRKLVGAEGVIITLALIASLGIVSPLVASAGEPAEASHPVSGVIGETDEGVAAVDVDEDAEAVDAADAATAGDSADSADSDAATDSDAAQDGDGDSASAGDSNGPAGDGADADAEGEDSAEESGAAVDADDADADDGANADEKNDAADDDDADDAKAENAEAEKSDEGKKSKSGVKNGMCGDDGPSPCFIYKPEGAQLRFQADTSFQEYLRRADDRSGKSLNTLGQILSYYTVFTAGDVTASHIVGPVLAGGTFRSVSGDNVNIGSGSQNSVASQEYDHLMPSYIGGALLDDNGKGLSDYKTNRNSDLPLVTGTVNKNIRDNIGGKLDGGKGTAVYNSSFVDMASLLSTDIKNQTIGLYKQNNKYVNGTYKVKVSPFLHLISVCKYTNNSCQTVSNHRTRSVWVSGDDKVQWRYDSTDRTNTGLTIKPGVTVILEDPHTILSNSHHGYLYIDASGMSKEELGKTDTVVVYEGKSEDAVIAPVRVRYQANGGYESMKHDDKEYNASGISVVWAYPDAPKVDSTRKDELHGHVVAPSAHVDFTDSVGNWNGAIVSQSVSTNAQGHMWPYRGTKLATHRPDKFTARARKTLLGGNLTTGKFSFTIGKSDGTVIETVTNETDGSVAFSEITLGDADFAGCTHDSDGKCTKDFYYLIREVAGDDNAITYDAAQFQVTVNATHTSVDNGATNGENDTSVTVNSVTYQKRNGDSWEAISSSVPEFVNQVKTTELKLTKSVEEDVDGGSNADTFEFQVTLKLPDNIALVPADSGDGGSSTPNTLYFDANTDHKGDDGTYGFACVPNADNDGCKTENGAIVKQKFYIPVGTKVVLPAEQAQNFEVATPSVAGTNQHYLKLTPQSAGDEVPSSMALPPLAVSYSGATSAACTDEPNKMCTTATVSVQARQTVELTDLPVGTQYSITENLPANSGYKFVKFEGCETTAREGQSCMGALSGSEGHTPSAVIVATNRRVTVQLSITKNVQNQDEIGPNAPEKNQEFQFVVTLWKGDSPVSGSFPVMVGGMQKWLICNETTRGAVMSSCGVQQANTTQLGNITLKHGETATITGLPWGTQFTVAEVTDNMGDFELVKYEVDSQEIQSTGKYEIGTAKLVTVTNRYSPKVVLPSTGGKAHPIMTAMFGLGVVCAGLAIAMLYLRRCE